MYKIYIVEDDQTISSVINETLTKWGFNSYQANDFSNILSEFIDLKPHLILMDVNLPYYDGFYWCDQIRRNSNVPIIFISSRTDDKDKIRGIIGGGDDYVEKPFSLDVLVAKIQAVLRRTYSYVDKSINVLSYGDLVLNLEKFIISCENKELQLTKNECRIMSLLMRASGGVVSRSKIIKSLWDDENFIDENTLTVNVTRLRKKLYDLKDNDIIVTIKGKGYKLDEL